MAERSRAEVKMAERTGAKATKDRTGAETMMAEQRQRSQSRSDDGKVDRSDDGRVKNDGEVEGTTVEQRRRRRSKQQRRSSNHQRGRKRRRGRDSRSRHSDRSDLRSSDDVAPVSSQGQHLIYDYRRLPSLVTLPRNCLMAHRLDRYLHRINETTIPLHSQAHLVYMLLSHQVLYHTIRVTHPLALPHEDSDEALGALKQLDATPRGEHS
ncbi:hypothetical protein Sjap_013861 [Stephania japonica]|uniref:Uncharacterized protein n=1 Tax=Stephania japonica TaxID=461633 RepID=A0AAP0IYS7_9MAGN